LRHRLDAHFGADNGGGRRSRNGNGVDAVDGRGLGIGDGQRDQPAHFSEHQVHKLQSDAERHCAVFSPRSFLLQLPAWRAGQPLPARLQRHHQVQALALFSLEEDSDVHVYYAIFSRIIIIQCL